MKNCGKIIGLVASIVMLGACQKDETISAQTGTDGTWVLQTLENTPVSETITLEFPEPGKIAGQAPCNRYFATQTAPAPWFKIDGVASTKRACPNLALEARYFSALARATLAEVQGDTLILDSEGGPVLVFKRAPRG